MIRIIKKICYTYKKNFRMFLQDNNRRIVLMDVPTHGNLGDQAIVLAEQQFFEKFFKDDILHMFSQDEFVCCKKFFKKNIRKDDLIIIHGGGFIGTLWEREEEVFVQLLNIFHNNQIIVFPQTIYFHENKMYELNRLNEALTKCENITLLVRDIKSYIFAKENLKINGESLMLVPDIVTFLTISVKKKTKKKRNILLCIRNDCERNVDLDDLMKFVSCLKSKGYVCIKTDTIINRRLGNMKIREQEVRRKIIQFATASLIITDRIHGMLFAALAGTPCIAFDNISNKVSGAYEWIKYLDYIKCIHVSDLDFDKIEEMIDLNHVSYTNNELNDYYESLEQVIKSKLKV